MCCLACHVLFVHAVQGIGMTVLAYDLRPNPVVEAMGACRHGKGWEGRRLVGCFETSPISPSLPPCGTPHRHPSAGIPYMSIEEILPLADVVSLHVPLLPSTYQIMNRPRCAISGAVGAAV